ncbi:MAG: pilus assembly protein PilP [Bdellovibrionales bacterium]|nr:pilus assembly protein PilP [Bdellovibrionales bacterium]
MSRKLIHKLLGHFIYLVVGLGSLGLAIFISTMFLAPTYSQEDPNAIPPPPLEEGMVDQLPPPPPMEEGLANQLPPPPPMDEGAASQLPPPGGGEVESGMVPPPPPLEPSGVSGEPELPSASQQTAAVIDEVLGLLEPFEYDGSNRRDPFKPYVRIEETGEVDSDSGSISKGPLLPLQRFDLNELKLTGIIWDVEDPQAMFVDPSGKTYRVGVNARVGRNSGYIAVIREGEVVVVESVRVRGEVIFNTKVIRLVE